jgi:RecT family
MEACPMNEITRIEQPPSMGLVPTTIPEALRLAELMSSAKLVPAALQKSPADCFLVIQQAIRWQLDPFAVAQECSVIQGKLMYGGKLVAAVINARGGLAERLSFTYEGEGDNRSITVSGRISGEIEPREVVVRLRDARTANKVWQTQPDQQLMYHGSRVWARRHAPELMLGVYSPEEFDEPAPLSSAAKRPSPPKPNVLLPAHDPETGEITVAPGDAGQAPAPVTLDKPAGAGADLTSDDVEAWDIVLKHAASKGMAELQTAWAGVPSKIQQTLKAALERRHKLVAADVDSKRGEV